MKKNMAILTDIWGTENELSEGWTVAELSEQEKKQTPNSAVLGKMIGPAFFPNSPSRNKRFYKKSLWEKVLNSTEIKSRLDQGLMFGSLGHETKRVSEEDIRNGKVSHVVKKLWIEEKEVGGKTRDVGMAEFWILDTVPAGRNLWAVVKSGSKLKVSSRASGDVDKNESVDGVPVVDESTYELETFDMVLEPGFEEAIPELVENHKKESNMPTIQELQDMVEEWKKKHSGLEEALKVEKALTVACQAKLDEAFKKLKPFEEIGHPNLLKRTLEASRIAIAEARKKNEALTKTLSENTLALEEYKKIGAPKEIVDVVKRATEVVEKYTKIGSLKSLQTLQENYEKATAEITRKNQLKEAMTLAKSGKITVEGARSLVEKLGFSEAKKVVSGITAPGTTERRTPGTAPRTKNIDIPMEECLSTRLFRRASNNLSE